MNKLNRALGPANAGARAMLLVTLMLLSSLGPILSAPNASAHEGGNSTIWPKEGVEDTGWVLLNATSCGSDLQIEFLVQHGCVAVLCELLSHPNMLVMAVEGLEKLLQVGDEAACRASGVSKTTDPRCGPNSHAALMDLEKLIAT